MPGTTPTSLVPVLAWLGAPSTFARSKAESRDTLFGSGLAFPPVLLGGTKQQGHADARSFRYPIASSERAPASLEGCRSL
jgi:hypothetical protein